MKTTEHARLLPPHQLHQVNLKKNPVIYFWFRVIVNMAHRVYPSRKYFILLFVAAVVGFVLDFLLEARGVLFAVSIVAFFSYYFYRVVLRKD